MFVIDPEGSIFYKDGKVESKNMGCRWEKGNYTLPNHNIYYDEDHSRIYKMEDNYWDMIDFVSIWEEMKGHILKREEFINFHYEHSEDKEAFLTVIEYEIRDDLMNSSMAKFNAINFLDDWLKEKKQTHVVSPPEYLEKLRHRLLLFEELGIINNLKEELKSRGVNLEFQNRDYLPRLLAVLMNEEAGFETLRKDFSQLDKSSVKTATAMKEVKKVLLEFNIESKNK